MNQSTLLLFSPLNPHWLSIWDGNDKTAPLMGRKVGSEIPKPITSSNKELFLELKTGVTGTGTGYRIEIELSK